MLTHFDDFLGFLFDSFVLPYLFQMVTEGLYCTALIELSLFFACVPKGYEQSSSLM